MAWQIAAFLVPLLSALAVIWAFRRMDGTRFAVSGVVGPYFAAVALLFGLFASLLATEVWQRVAHNSALVSTEMNSLRALLRLEEAFDPQGNRVRTLVDEYLQDLKRDIGTPHAPKQGKSLNTIKNFYALAATPGFLNASPAATQAYLSALETIRSARVESLESLEQRISPEKLLVLFIFCVLTQISIALCHTANMRALATTVMLFSLAAATAGGIMTALDDPYNGIHIVTRTIAGDLP